MKINIETKNTTLNRAIEDFIKEKINSLEKFIKILYNGKYKSPSSGKAKPVLVAWVEIGRETLHHKRGPFFRAECQIRFSGKSIRAEAVSKDLRVAITEVKDELQIGLKKQKEKIISKKKRKSRVLKKRMKISPQARFDQKGRTLEEGI
ncbi:MAG: ribosome hibernation-promoting factor, HPF/YfiA family [Candidatus Nealsonbacteria bacterium]